MSQKLLEKYDWLVDEKPSDNEIHDSCRCLSCNSKATSEDLIVYENMSNESVYWKFPDFCKICRNRFLRERYAEIRHDAIVFFAEDPCNPYCKICKNNNEDELQFDHIFGNGKLDKKIMSNQFWYYDYKGQIQLLCAKCNRQKSDLTLETIQPIMDNLTEYFVREILGFNN